MEPRQFVNRRTVCPEQSWPPQVGTVAHMLNRQRECAEAGGNAMKLSDGIRNGKLIPGWHERKVDIVGRHQPSVEAFQLPRNPRQFTCDFGRHLQANKDADQWVLVERGATQATGVLT
jgi:hypothetical protein